MRFIFILIIGLFLYQAPSANAADPAGLIAASQEKERDILSDYEKAAKEVKLVRRVNPEYPMKSSENRICGHVIAKFTVTKKGTVKNIKIIESQPKKLFEKAVIKALRKFVYEPRVVDGEKVDTKGVKIKHTFNHHGVCEG